MDNDLEQMTREQLIAEVQGLRDGIRTVANGHISHRGADSFPLTEVKVVEGKFAREFRGG